MPLPIQIILTVLPIILPPLISFCAIMYQHLLLSMPEKKRELVDQIVHTAVLAIEQTSSTALNSSGKKQAAMQMATEMLQHLHINVSEGMLSAMIEAAVFALHQSQNPGVSPLPSQASTLIQNAAG